jgi:hypothetical protein
MISRKWVKEYHQANAMPHHPSTVVNEKTRIHPFMPRCLMYRKLAQNASHPSKKDRLPLMMSKLSCWHQYAQSLP